VQVDEDNLGELAVSEFVGLFNQTLDFAYPSVTIVGELANFRVSKNRWVYFDLKDDQASVKFFGTVYNLPGPLEDGMLLKVRGQPRLHNLYGFSINILSMQPAGEGSIRRAADLLRAKLAAEGLFDENRKRSLPYPPTRIGLITSRQSAAYADFLKVLTTRWQGIAIELIDVQVQGEVSAAQITAALEQFNSEISRPEVLVVIRGGGSAEDLAAFSSEAVTRAVAASRIPTLVAIGHEIDLSLAELAADRRASTPSNAAELLVPDRRHTEEQLRVVVKNLEYYGSRHVQRGQDGLRQQTIMLEERTKLHIKRSKLMLETYQQLLNALNPNAILRRGYALVRHQGRLIRTSSALHGGDMIEIQLASGSVSAAVSLIKGSKRVTTK